MKKLILKHALATRWMHWINFPLLGLMIWSGLLIYWANRIYAIKIGNYTVLKFFPNWFYNFFHIPYHLAEGMAWHFAVMWLFFLNGIAYVVYTLWSGEWRLLVPGKGALKEAFQVVLFDLKLRKTPLPEKKYNAAQQIAYTLIIVMGILSVISGIAIFKPVQVKWITALCGGYEAARVIHFVLTIGYLVFFVIHLAMVIKAGWKNFIAMVSGYELKDVE